MLVPARRARCEAGCGRRAGRPTWWRCTTGCARSGDMSHAVLFATGPWLLRDAFRAATGEPGQLAVGYAGEHEVRGTRIMVYSLGQWCAHLHCSPS